MLRRLRDMEWTFSATAETVTALLLGAAVVVALVV
jgi:hypothetical protein